jgi:hypothetical protein
MTFSCLGYVASNSRLISFKRRMKEVKGSGHDLIIIQNLAEETEDLYEKLQLGYEASWPRFEPDARHSTATFSCHLHSSC